MGVVWKAQDMVLGRTVAIKVLPADVSRDENRRRMFLEEARVASSVSNAHIASLRLRPPGPPGLHRLRELRTPR